MDLYTITVSTLFISFCGSSSDDIINAINVEIHSKGTITWNDAILMIFSFIMVMLIMMFIVNCVYFLNEWCIKYQLKRSMKLELQDFDEIETESEQIELLSIM